MGKSNLANGLFLGIEEFRALPTPKKLDVLYENQLKSLKDLKEQKKEYMRIKLNQKIQYFLLTALVGSSVFLYKFALGVN